ncbi:MAG TPA: hypothetical protein VFP56_07085 [Candidatus Limnocylindrales bacterium]|nr:hypothetical protein [Candidatus Limnocylindrales bacterium]
MSMSKCLIGGLLTALVCIGCAPISLRTQPAPISACMDALATGTLVSSSLSGLAIKAPDGTVVEVEWPFEYTARRDMTGLALIDSAGVLVAHEGQVIQMGGGSGADNVFHACPGSITLAEGLPSR